MKVLVAKEEVEGVRKRGGWWAGGGGGEGDWCGEMRRERRRETTGIQQIE